MIIVSNCCLTPLLLRTTQYYNNTVIPPRPANILGRGVVDQILITSHPLQTVDLDKVLPIKLTTPQSLSQFSNIGPEKLKPYFHFIITQDAFYYSVHA